MANTIVARGRKYTKWYDDVAQVYRYTITVHDQHYQDENGAWQPVNESFVDDPVYGGKSCNTVQHKFQVANGGKRRWYPRRNVPGEYVEITEIQYYSNRWRTLNLPTPVWRSNFVEWDMTNLYASVTHTWHRIKTDFILKNSSAYTQLRFAVTLVGLTLDGWNLVSTTDSTIVGTIDPPTAVDATGADVPVTAVYSGGYIEWSVQTAGYTFPITVDPTFTDGYGGDATTYKDARIAHNSIGDGETYNYGSEDILAVGNINVANNFTDRTLIQFGWGDIGETDTITSATLYLTPTGDYSDNARTYRVYKLKRAWVEGTRANADDNPATGVTWLRYDTSNSWQTEGAAGANDYDSTEVGSRSFSATETLNQEISFSLSGSVKGDIDGGYGWIIRADTETNDGYVFASSDHATTGYRPVLVVEYTEAGTDTSNSIHAYLNGSSTSSSSNTAYLCGASASVINVLAYLAGKNDDVSSIHGYLVGISSNISSQSAYIEGSSAEFTANASQPAYLQGYGQIITPDGDIGSSSAGSWLDQDNGAALYAALKETSPDDATYVYLSGEVAVNDYFEVSLEDPDPDEPGAGNIVVYWRGRDQNNAGTLQIKVELRQGSTVIASDTQTMTAVATTYSFTLTAEQRNLISDWSDLRLRFTIMAI